MPGSCEVPQDEAAAEFEWLLKEDVTNTLARLTQILADCSASVNQTPTNYNLVHSSLNQHDFVKVNLQLEGYKITCADINIRLASKHPIQTIKTCIKETPTNPFCWRLHQIQDAQNHLSNAIDLVSLTKGKKFETAEEVLFLIDNVMYSIQRSRSSLLIPNKILIEELQHSQNMQAISPALPLDYSISFYVHSQNLVCSVYHLAHVNNRPQVKAEFQAEAPIGFLPEMLVLLSLAMQTCQQLKDKIQTLVKI